MLFLKCCIKGRVKVQFAIACFQEGCSREGGSSSKVHRQKKKEDYKTKNFVFLNHEKSAYEPSCPPGRSLSQSAARRD